jgi:surface carbohydrate biosynthesis protein
MTRRHSVAIVVDHPQRDLVGVVLVAQRLCDVGIDVYLVPLNLVVPEVFSLLPDFVLLNYLRPSLDPLVHGMLDARIAFGVLDTEGGLYGDLAAYTRTLSRDADVVRGVDVMCVWGRKMFDHLASTGYVAADRMVITGAPRFDVYNPNWRAAFVRSKPQRPMILFNTKVAVANPQYHSVEDEIRLLVDRVGLPIEEVLRHRDVGNATIAATIELANHVGSTFPAADVIVRPHPHERLSTYADGLDPALANVHAIREGTVDGWILNATALVHRQCTTAVEAGWAGVPAIAPMWVPSAADAPGAEEVSVRCESADELDEVLAAVLAGESVVDDAVRRALDRITEDWFYRIDGRAHDRVAHAVAPRVDTGKPRAVPARRRFFRSHEKWASLRGAAGRMGRAMGAVGAAGPAANLVHPAARRWPSTFKSFTVSDVQRLLVSIGRASSPAAGTATARAVAARDVDAYLWGYRGHSVLVTPAEGCLDG